MENFIKGRGGLARSTKIFNRKNSHLFYGKWGGGLTQSIKSLTEKVKENPNWGEGRGGVGQENVEFFHILSVFNFDGSPNAVRL